ncbi:unnamed protein product [Allacma fusca]|uniref:Glutamyl-tRNA(Gln) amidotransferase subunit A, mitochondrial n=1 Tax=Allacma fusca TaxID=39272 RepID=A0A8J2NVM4_9HEXA|nr:unnamed protein product [Allacma fusca]
MSLSIKEVVSRINSGSLTGRSLAEAAIDRAHKQKHLNAFTYICSKKDVERQLGEGSPKDLPLNGIPIAVKDNFCVKGMPATCGSKMLHNFKPPYTATVVQKLVDAGAVVLGKTNMDEFGMGNGTVDSIFGPTRNIWGLEKFMKDYSLPDWHVPGGSSGGSAVAVSAGICFAALGSDTGGSTRNPASYCGVVGLKPTYGLLSRFGLIPLVNSMDVPGILTRTVDDCALIFNTIKGFDDKDSTSVQHGLNGKKVETDDNTKVAGIKIGMPSEFFSHEMSPEVVECWKEISTLLKSSGAVVDEVSLPHTSYSIACYSVLNPCEVASNMARYDGLRYGHRTSKPESLRSTEALYAQTRHEGFNDVVRGRILTGNYFLLKENYEKFFCQAMKVRRLICQDFENVWKAGTELLLTPVTLTAAPTYSEFIKWDNRKQSSVQDYCTQSANMAGLPAISIPIKLNTTGLPLSVQLIGPKFSEELIFQVAKFIEASSNFQQLHATLDN